MPSGNTPSKRACDACHKRKVRCDGDGDSCRNCKHTGLDCTYNTVPKKKGPKGKTSNILSNIRQHQNHEPAEPAMFHNIAGEHGPVRFATPPVSPSYKTMPGPLTPNIVDACVDFFLSTMYPSMPILTKSHLRDLIASIETSPAAYCVIISLCALMYIQPGYDAIVSSRKLVTEVPSSSLSQNTKLGVQLLESAIKTRKTLDATESISPEIIMTSYFIFAGLFRLNRTNEAWMNLRDATALAQIYRLHEEARYREFEAHESCRLRRLFWLLFMAEREFLLHRSLPALTLHATIAPPSRDLDSTPTLIGFVYMTRLYQVVDDNFVGLLNKSRPECPPAWLVDVQHRLGDALPQRLDPASITEVQAVDLRVSQQWLRNIVWQLALSHGAIFSKSVDLSLRVNYPMQIATDLVSSIRQLSKEAMEAHGISLVEKIFDLTYALVDVMYVTSHVPQTPATSPNTEQTPETAMSCLIQLVTLVATLRGGEARFLPLVMSKIEEKLPTMMRQLPARLVQRSSTEMSNMSPQTSSQSGQSQSSLQIDRSRKASSVSASGGAWSGGSSSVNGVKFRADGGSNNVHNASASRSMPSRPSVSGNVYNANDCRSARPTAISLLSANHDTSRSQTHSPQHLEFLISPTAMSFTSEAPTLDSLCSTMSGCSAHSSSNEYCGTVGCHSPDGETTEFSSARPLCYQATFLPTDHSSDMTALHYAARPGSSTSSLLCPTGSGQSRTMSHLAPTV